MVRYISTLFTSIAVKIRLYLFHKSLVCMVLFRRIPGGNYSGVTQRCFKLKLAQTLYIMCMFIRNLIEKLTKLPRNYINVTLSTTLYEATFHVIVIFFISFNKIRKTKYLRGKMYFPSDIKHIFLDERVQFQNQYVQNIR